MEKSLSITFCLGATHFFSFSFLLSLSLLSLLNVYFFFHSFTYSYWISWSPFSWVHFGSDERTSIVFFWEPFVFCLGAGLAESTLAPGGPLPCALESAPVQVRYFPTRSLAPGRGGDSGNFINTPRPSYFPPPPELLKYEMRVQRKFLNKVYVCL